MLRMSSNECIIFPWNQFIESVDWYVTVLIQRQLIQLQLQWRGISQQVAFSCSDTTEINISIILSIEEETLQASFYRRRLSVRKVIWLNKYSNLWLLFTRRNACYRGMTNIFVYIFMKTIEDEILSKVFFYRTLIKLFLFSLFFSV